MAKQATPKSPRLHSSGRGPQFDQEEPQGEDSELSCLEEELRRSRRRFSQLLEALEECVILSDSAGRVAQMNPAAERSTGWSSSEALGQPLAGMLVIEAGAPPAAAVQDSGSGRPALSSPPFLGLLTSKRGEQHSVWVQRRALEASQGGISAWVFQAPAQRDLQQSSSGEDRSYRALVESAPYCVHELDLEGHFLSINPVGLQMLGLDSEEEIVGRQYLETVAPADRQRIAALLRLAGQGQNSEFEFETAGEEPRQFSSCFIALPDERGTITKLLGLTRDITRRRHAEQQLQYRLDFENLIASISTRFIQLLPSQVDGAIHHALRDIGEFVGVDRAYVLLFSEDREFASCTHIWSRQGIAARSEQIQSLSCKDFPEGIGKIRRGGVVHVPLVAELPAEAASEQRMWRMRGIRSILALPLSASGNVIGALGLDSVVRPKSWSSIAIALLRIAGEIFANALERKRSEEELQRYAELVNGIAMASSVLMTNPDLELALVSALGCGGSRMTDCDRLALAKIRPTVKDAPPCLRNIAEWCREGIRPSKGRAEGVELPLGADDLSGWVRRLSEGSILTLRPETSSPQVVDRLFSDGTLAQKVFPVFSGGDLWGCLSVSQCHEERTWHEREESAMRILADTIGGALERHQAQKEVHLYKDRLEDLVRERTAELETANREMRAFTYSVSHDLRGPLRHIDGYSQLLLEEYRQRLDVEALRFLETISASSRRLGDLIDDLLRLSRLGRRKVQTQQVDCERMVREVWQEVTARSDSANIRFRLNPLPPAQADPLLLRQVWTNLLENAVKYTSKQGAPSVKVFSRSSNGRLWYRVEDNGVGFDQRFADKLFGVFQRLHREEDFPGTGVGLAVVQRIVHKHGGLVQAEGEVGKGAAFEFALR